MSISKKLACNLIVLPEVPKSGLGGGLKAYPWMGGGGGAGGASTGTAKRTPVTQGNSGFPSSHSCASSGVRPALPSSRGPSLSHATPDTLLPSCSLCSHVSMENLNLMPLPLSSSAWSQRPPSCQAQGTLCPSGACDIAPCPPFSNCSFLGPFLALPRSRKCWTLYPAPFICDTDSQTVETASPIKLPPPQGMPPSLRPWSRHSQDPCHTILTAKGTTVLLILPASSQIHSFLSILLHPGSGPHFILHRQPGKPPNGVFTSRHPHPRRPTFYTPRQSV